eukprot:1148812-Pelagomonas_calceolata.AAC.10
MKNPEVSAYSEFQHTHTERERGGGGREKARRCNLSNAEGRQACETEGAGQRLRVPPTGASRFLVVGRQLRHPNCGQLQTAS